MSVSSWLRSLLMTGIPVLLVPLLRGLLHHGGGISKGHLGNVLYEFSGVLQVGIRSFLQCVQYPDQIP